MSDVLSTYVVTVLHTGSFIEKETTKTTCLIPLHVNEIRSKQKYVQPKKMLNCFKVALYGNYNVF